MEKESKVTVELSGWLREVKAFAEYQHGEIKDGDRRGLIMMVAEPGNGTKYGGFGVWLGDTESIGQVLRNTITNDVEVRTLVLAALNMYLQDRPKDATFVASTIMDGVKGVERLRRTGRNQGESKE